MDATVIAPVSGFVVPIDQVHDDGDDMRRVKVNARADLALTSSIKRRGVLQPIAVRPAGNGFRIVFGRRRLRCARAAGLEVIPADVREWRDDEIRAVQAAENLQRAPPHQIDNWLTVCDLTDAGYSIAEAAEEMGLDDRQARQMERLGRLHPDLLKLVEIDMPADHHLRVIANASQKIQRQVASGGKGKLVVRGPGDRQIVQWGEIASRCRVTRIPQSLAIFDVGAHADLWEEDLFAQPTDPDRISATNIAKFMKLQQAALEVRVEADRATRKRVQLADCNSAGDVALPAGWRPVSYQAGLKPKRTECVFVALQPDGRVTEVLAVDVAAQKAADKVTSDRQKSKAKAQAKVSSQAASDDADTDDGDADIDQPTPEPEAKPGITKAGLNAIAAAKTAALRLTLREGITELPLERLVALLLLALTADNARISVEWNDEIEDHHWHGKCLDIAETLLLPGGGLTEVSAADVRTLAGNALARLLTVGGPDTANRSYGSASGAAAEWIGAAIGAGDAVGRFDHEGFLAQVNGEELKRAAEAAGIKSTGTVKALRERLVGKLPDWRPSATQFGAPGPTA